MGRVPSAGPGPVPARTFLFTSLVPPSMVLARLRSMPRTSAGMLAAYPPGSAAYPGPAGSAWVPRLGRSGRISQASRIGGPGDARRAEQIRGSRLDALVELAGVHLADRALRARRQAARDPGADPLVGPAADLLFAPQPDQAIPDDRIAPPAVHPLGGALAGQPDEVGSAGPADPVHPPEPAPETICRSPLSVALATRHPVPTSPTRSTVRDARAVDEHLEELRLASHVPQRPYVDARLAHLRAGSR